MSHIILNCPPEKSLARETRDGPVMHVLGRRFTTNTTLFGQSHHWVALLFGLGDFAIITGHGVIIHGEVWLGNVGGVLEWLGFELE